MTMQTTVNVPPDRQVTLTLPPETPIGPMSLTVNGEALVEEPERRNPDTPEFRAMVERSSSRIWDLRDWHLQLKQQAIAEGRDPKSVAGMLQPTPENKEAFRIWKEARQRNGHTS